MHPARFWRPLDDGRIHCYLCPRDCKLRDGQTGFCFVRKHEGGELVSLAYGKPYAIHVDPVEKKPLFHFLPGTPILSIGTAGCNLGCKFCQNWDISKAQYDQDRALDFGPDAAVATAIRHHCPSIAFTYNDPTIWAEYAIDIARAAHRSGLCAVMVTNGFINDEVIDEVYGQMDAANIDIKAFTEDFYHKVTLSHLAPVLRTIEHVLRLGVWVELTNLMIPGLNDSPEETRQLCGWILDHIGDRVPLHFTAFHPDFKLQDRPRTPAGTLRHAREIALDAGLKYVYVGNVHDDDGSTTHCPSCHATLIRRSWHDLLMNRLRGDRCPDCGAKVDIITAVGARAGAESL